MTIQCHTTLLLIQKWEHKRISTSEDETAWILESGSPPSDRQSHRFSHDTSRTPPPLRLRPLRGRRSQEGLVNPSRSQTASAVEPRDSQRCLQVPLGCYRDVKNDVTQCCISLSVQIIMQHSFSILCRSKFCPGAFL